MDWEISSADLIENKGKIIAGNGFAVWWANLPEKLVAHILEVNPLYKFDDGYSSYALEGNAANDADIPIVRDQPMGYALRFVFRSQGRNMGVYRNGEYVNGSFKYWVCFLDDYGAKRTAFVFDLSEVVARTALIGVEERMKLRGFKDAMRLRNVDYSDVSAYYLCEEIYKTL